jgi:FKBP-type peptidyl-prolyl cis-trans isomerase
MSAASIAALAASVATMTATTAAAQQAVLPGGTRVAEVKAGTGAIAEPGRAVAVHYTGWLYVDGGKGTKFDSSRNRGQPFIFTLGLGEVILGWDEGVAGMKVGGQRTLIVPPEAGYGERGAGGVIPPGATLMFDVELLAVQ